MPRTPMTDTIRLPLPPWLSVSSRDMLAEQRVEVSSRWWEERLNARGLPGGPLRVQRDEVGEFLTRADVWKVGSAGLDHDEDVLSLLWHALAWGAGIKSVRNEERRMDAVAADPAHAADLLRQAAALAPENPQSAYTVLHPRGTGVIRQLGPAFGTKFLYFAGQGVAEHPSVILDKRAATALAQAGWSSLRLAGGWPPMTYGRYCILAQRWADELSQAGAPVQADQVEYALFHSPQSRR
jgi:hypothetical protein